MSKVFNGSLVIAIFASVIIAGAFNAKQSGQKMMSNYIAQYHPANR